MARIDRCPKCDAPLPEKDLTGDYKDRFRTFTCPKCKVTRQFYVHGQDEILVPMTATEKTPAG